MVTLSLICTLADFTIIDPDIIRCVNLSPGTLVPVICAEILLAERNSILVVNPAISFLC